MGQGECNRKCHLKDWNLIPKFLADPHNLHASLGRIRSKSVLIEVETIIKKGRRRKQGLESDRMLEITIRSERARSVHHGQRRKL